MTAMEVGMRDSMSTFVSLLVHASLNHTHSLSSLHRNIHLVYRIMHSYSALVSKATGLELLTSMHGLMRFLWNHTLMPPTWSLVIRRIQTMIQFPK